MVLQKDSKSLVFLKFPYFPSKTQRRPTPPLPDMDQSGASPPFNPQEARSRPEKKYIKSGYRRLAWRLCGCGWVRGHGSQAGSHAHCCQVPEKGPWLRWRMWSKRRSVARSSNGGSSSCSAEEKRPSTCACTASGCGGRPMPTRSRGIACWGVDSSRELW